MTGLPDTPIPGRAKALIRATTLCRRADTLLLEFGMPNHMKHMTDRDNMWSFDLWYEVDCRARAEALRDRMVCVMGAKWLSESRDWDGVKSFVVGFGEGLMATILFPEQVKGESKGALTCWAA